MWAATLLLRLGRERDVLVGVQVDSDASVARLRTLFAPWIEAHPPEVPDPFPAAFSLRIDPDDDQESTATARVRAVPQLRHGATAIARSREPDDVLRAFALTLGGIHHGLDHTQHIWVPLRPFVKDGSLVLVEIDAPAMVNDRQLELGGVHELAAWSVAVAGDGRVSIPPPLPDLAWHDIGVHAPSPEWQHFQIAGIVVMQSEPISTADLVARLALKSPDATWFALVAALAERGAVTCALDDPGVRQQVRHFLVGS